MQLYDAHSQTVCVGRVKCLCMSPVKYLHGPSLMFINTLVLSAPANPTNISPCQLEYYYCCKAKDEYLVSICLGWLTLIKKIIGQPTKSIVEL